MFSFFCKHDQLERLEVSVEKILCIVGIVMGTFEQVSADLTALNDKVTAVGAGVDLLLKAIAELKAAGAGATPEQLDSLDAQVQSIGLTLDEIKAKEVV